MILVCKTSAGAAEMYDYEFAVLALSPARAKELLGYRQLWRKLHQTFDTLYSIEIFEATPEWCTEPYVVAPTDLEDEDFYEITGVPAPKTPLCAPAPTCAETLRIVADGVTWSAQPRHSPGEFETSVLPWCTLEAIANSTAVFLPEVAYHAPDKETA